ncbi:hypothetical protein [Clostridium baratii]|uniref:hypothetical protein n=1 Tax=Clostridium baratii TaxID=1561 RepID=UPI0030D0646D
MIIILIIISIILLRECLIYREVKNYFKVIPIREDDVIKEKKLLLMTVKEIMFYLKESNFYNKDDVYIRLQEIYDAIIFNVRLSNDEIEFIKYTLKIVRGIPLIIFKSEFKFYEWIMKEGKNLKLVSILKCIIICSIVIFLVNT